MVRVRLAFVQFIHRILIHAEDATSIVHLTCCNTFRVGLGLAVSELNCQQKLLFAAHFYCEQHAQLCL